MKKLKVFCIISLVFVLISNLWYVSADETTPVPPSVNVRIDYLTGIVTVTAGSGGSNKFYFSTDKKKTWELIETTTGTLDVRELMKSSDVTLYFKGNKDPTPKEQIILAEDKTLKAVYTVEKGVGKITFTNAARQIEYRVGANSNWQDKPSNFVTTMYEVTGATIQFRTKATTAVRAGKIVSVKIKKRPKAPSVKVDGSKLEISGLKSGTTQYRLSTATVWETFNPGDPKVKSIKIADLLSGSATENAQISAGIIEFRTIATDKLAASAVSSIEFVRQRAAPTTGTVILDGTTLSIPGATSANPYEYLALQSHLVPDLSVHKWKSITNDKPIIIQKAGTAEIIPGDKIYVRLKAVKDKATGIENMASQYVLFPVVSITVGKPTATPKPTPTQKPTTQTPPVTP